MKKFDEWVEAEVWARENDYSLEPTGTFTGEESFPLSCKIGALHIRLMKRVAEVIAVTERNREILLNITEYSIVTQMCDAYESELFYEASDYEDAKREWVECVNSFIPAEQAFHEAQIAMYDRALKTCKPSQSVTKGGMKIYHERMLRELKSLAQFVNQ